MNSPTTTKQDPQSFASSYAPRIRTYGNSLLTPIIPPANTQLPPVRTTKRGTTAINYAEDGFDEDDFEESDGPLRRPTGLRSLRREETSNVERGAPKKELGREINHPVDVQGIWREWMQPARRRLMFVYHDSMSSHLIYSSFFFAQAQDA